MPGHVSPSCFPAISSFEGILNIFMFLLVVRSGFTDSSQHWLEGTWGGQLVHLPPQSKAAINARTAQAWLCLAKSQNPSRTVTLQPLLPEQCILKLHYHSPEVQPEPTTLWYLVAPAPCRGCLQLLRRAVLLSSWFKPSWKLKSTELLSSSSPSSRAGELKVKPSVLTRVLLKTTERERKQ